ncbi:MAG: transposase, partial [Deltaproteobacteria bacterium]|nr:transposase [Deltaproteobacteria bacterium]
MARRKRVLVPGATYHVFTRGNRRAEVFGGQGDYAAYVEDLQRLPSQHGARLLAFCLMPNHTHLCVHTPVGADPLNVIMQRLNLRHSWRFNLAHSVRGRLNESRYGSQVVDSLRYLKRVVRYIHLNPVKANLVPRPEDWPFSSHLAYAGTSYSWVSTAAVLELAGGHAGWSAWMGGETPDEEERLFEPSAGQVHLRPIEELEALSYPTSDEPLRVPSAWPPPRPTEAIEVVARGWAAEHEASLEVIASPSRQRSMKEERVDLAIDLRRRGYLVSEIAPVIGRRVSATSRMINRARGVAEDQAVYQASSPVFEIGTWPPRPLAGQRPGRAADGAAPRSAQGLP